TVLALEHGGTILHPLLLVEKMAFLSCPSVSFVREACAWAGGMNPTRSAIAPRAGYAQRWASLSA
ncbi:MAG: hypothetical protein ACT4QE_04450, partial [Anaerolineales bacterium]